MADIGQLTWQERTLCERSWGGEESQASTSASKSPTKATLLFGSSELGGQQQQGCQVFSGGEFNRGDGVPHHVPRVYS